MANRLAGAAPCAQVCYSKGLRREGGGGSPPPFYYPYTLAGNRDYLPDIRRVHPKPSEHKELRQVLGR